MPASLFRSAVLSAVAGFLGFTTPAALAESSALPDIQATGDVVAASTIDRRINVAARRAIERGRQIFRHDTFGSEQYWGGRLRLHEAIAGAAFGGVGPGVGPKTALAVGLKVDLDALPAPLIEQLRAGQVDLDAPATTLALLKLDAVVGLEGRFDAAGNLRTLGVQCALCHSDVDDALAEGIGHRLDGWANRDLNVGAIVSLAPNLAPIADVLGVDVATVRKVLASWDPGRYDALLDKDGKAFRPDGRQAGTLIPPAFGLAGVNLHTWTGFGSVPYWNAYVAVTQMHGSGTFFDARLANPDQYPVAARTGAYDVRGVPDRVTSKLAALHLYQLALAAPKPPAGSFNAVAAERGARLFRNKADCARCHVPPLFTEPGHNLHTPEELGIDAFQANRSPTRMYRTAPLAGLWTHTKGGFYHDGRFPTLTAVLNHYDRRFGLGLTAAEKRDLAQYLLSL